MKRCVDMYIFLIKHLAKKDFITLHSALIFSNVVPKHIFSADRNASGKGTEEQCKGSGEF